MTVGVLRMPRLGESMEEGKLVEWLVNLGEPFKRGQEILEVETDKTIVEFPALGDGTLIETLVGHGDMVSVGTPIARIEVGEGPDWTGDEASIEETENTTQSEMKVAEEVAGEAAGEDATAVPAQAGVSACTPPGASGSTQIRATPLARRMARHQGIDLGMVVGSGRRDRIERADVEAQAAATNTVQQVAGVTYLKKGPETGTPVVLLHGFGADHITWGGVQTRLSAIGRQTFSFDLPGHGATVQEARTAADLHGPLDAALAELGLGTAHLVAHSMGAIAAVALAQTRGAKSLTLIAPAGLGHSIDAEFLRGFAHAASSGEISHLLGRITEGPHGLSSAMLTDIHASVARRRLTDLADALVGGSGQAVNIRLDLANLADHIPVHLILGHRDQILDWRETLDISPRIAIHNLPRTGHSPHWEALAEVASIMTDITR